MLSQDGRTTLISSVIQSMPLYVFSCFKVLESICNKLDSLSRAFWWGHEPGVRKLHLLHWDEVCKAKSMWGLGLKKFSLMNQAMVAKQFWRISHNPQSLMATAFKAKYFPRCSIHEYPLNLIIHGFREALSTRKIPNSKTVVVDW